MKKEVCIMGVWFEMLEVIFMYFMSCVECVIYFCMSCELWGFVFVLLGVI